MSDQFLIILTDSKRWTVKFEKALKDQGFVQFGEKQDAKKQLRTVVLEDILASGWDITKGLPSELIPPKGSNYIIYNRIAVSLPLPLLSMAQQILELCELYSLQVINDRHCHSIGISKIMQAAICNKLNIPTPSTSIVSTKDVLEKEILKIDKDQFKLLKPNVGGFGRNIHQLHNEFDISLVDFSEFIDGLAVLQTKVISDDNRVHRVETIGKNVIYEVSSVIESFDSSQSKNKTPDFNFCLAKKQPEQLQIEIPTEEILSIANKLCTEIRMEMGSFEYILQNSIPYVVDINPVSSWISNIGELKENPYLQFISFIESKMIKYE